MTKNIIKPAKKLPLCGNQKIHRSGGAQLATKAHVCPLREDLDGDKTTKCRCCGACQDICADGI